VCGVLACSFFGFSGGHRAGFFGFAFAAGERLLLGLSCVRGKAPEWDFDFSIHVPNGMHAEKFSEGPNIRSNFSGMDLRHARGCIFQDYLHNSSFNKVVGS
jgi:hypothetical protein